MEGAYRALPGVGPAGRRPRLAGAPGAPMATSCCRLLPWVPDNRTELALFHPTRSGRAVSGMTSVGTAPPRLTLRVILGLVPRTHPSTHREGCVVRSLGAHGGRHARGAMGPGHEARDDICGCGRCPNKHLSSRGRAGGAHANKRGPKGLLYPAPAPARDPGPRAPCGSASGLTPCRRTKPIRPAAATNPAAGARPRPCPRSSPNRRSA